MKTLIEKLRALAETEKKATPGPWAKCIAHDGRCSCESIWSVPADAPVLQVTRNWGDGIEGTDTWLEYGSTTDEVVQANKDLIADSRTLLEEFLESWFAQHEALELAERCAMTREHKAIYTAALNLATTPHP